MAQAPSFEFDPAKSAANKAKRGIDFEEAQALWADPDALEVPAHFIQKLERAARIRGVTRQSLVNEVALRSATAGTGRLGHLNVAPERLDKRMVRAEGEADKIFLREPKRFPKPRSVPPTDKGAARLCSAIQEYLKLKT